MNIYDTDSLAQAHIGLKPKPCLLNNQAKHEAKAKENTQKILGAPTPMTNHTSGDSARQETAARSTAAWFCCLVCSKTKQCTGRGPKKTPRKNLGAPTPMTTNVSGDWGGLVASEDSSTDASTINCCLVRSKTKQCTRRGPRKTPRKNLGAPTPMTNHISEDWGG